MIKKILLSTALTASLFATEVAELNVNNTDLELGYQVKLPHGAVNVEGIAQGDSYFGVKYMTGDGGNSDATIEMGVEDYMEVNFGVMQKIGNTGFEGGFGFKVNHTEDFTSVPLGIMGKYPINMYPDVPMSIGASLFYAPSVLTFEDGENYSESRIEFSAEPIRDVELSIGYRNMQTDYEGLRGDFTYNKSVYFGVKMRFSAFRG